MSDEFRYPEGYDPDLVEELGDTLKDEGYELIETDSGKAYRHPDTAHTVYLSESSIPGQEIEPGDDLEM